MRSFIAIPLNQEVADALAPIQRALPVGRPVPPDNLHLTLAFLDDQTEETLEALHEELLTLSAEPFSVAFSELACIGRVLAVGVQDNPSLTALHQKVQSATRRTGITLPRRRFRPHVTIARMKPEHSQTLHPMLISQTSVVPDLQVIAFGLYESTLRPEGARHDILMQYPLG